MGSEHEDLLRQLDHVAAYPLQGGSVARKAAAAIRKLEAEVAAGVQALQSMADRWSATIKDRDNLRAELQALREDRDRISANYDRLLTEHIAVMDERNTARQELQALREATSWRPIESAPKHKRLLVVGAQGAGYEIAHPYQIIEGGQWRWWSGNETLPFAPTHWMPLPAPPTREEEG